jgi:hypothetical protein
MSEIGFKNIFIFPWKNPAGILRLNNTIIVNE